MILLDTLPRCGRLFFLFEVGPCRRHAVASAQRMRPRLTSLPCCGSVIFSVRLARHTGGQFGARVSPLDCLRKAGLGGFHTDKISEEILCRIKQAIQKYGLRHIKPQSGLKLQAGLSASLHSLSSLLQYGLKADFPRCDALLAYGRLSFTVWPDGPPMAL